MEKSEMEYSVHDDKDNRSYTVKILNEKNKTSFHLACVPFGQICVFHIDILVEAVSTNTGLFMKKIFFLRWKQEEQPLYEVVLQNFRRIPVSNPTLWSSRFVFLT
eukprot:snap_masked-scaffold_3-processed-gene-19.29-mRNA-1 protein AED:1.00 eAED:1.00 QI:0/-1/0/0/-1/1/1/0/104